MKKIFLFLFFILTSFGYAQNPAPPGCRTFDKLDTNNDGFTEFEIDYYLNNVRNYALSEFGYNLNGYNLVLYPSQMDLYNNTNLIGSTYTNTTINQQYCYLKITYSGSGISYNQADLDYYLSCHILMVHQPTSDFDNDSVSNGDEDLNNNFRLGDDDTDADGIPNFKDTDDDQDGVLSINEDYNNNGNLLDDDINFNSIPDYLDNTATLLIHENSLSKIEIFPNPASKTLNIKNINTFDISITDTTGKIIYKIDNAPNNIDISNLNSGMYFLKIYTNNTTTIKKIIKN
jgi:hypothetical protein